MPSLPAADLVRALFDAFSARDVDAALALADEGLEFWPQGTAERAGRDEPYLGHEGLRQYMADVAAVWDELSVHPGELRVAGRGVVAFGHARGRPAGSAVELDIPVIWVFKVTGDRVCSIRVVKTAAEAETVLAEQRAGETEAGDVA